MTLMTYAVANPAAVKHKKTGETCAIRPIAYLKTEPQPAANRT